MGKFIEGAPGKPLMIEEASTLVARDAERGGKGFDLRGAELGDGVELGKGGGGGRDVIGGGGSG